MSGSIPRSSWPRSRAPRSAGRGAADLVRRAALLVAAIDHAIAAVLAGEPEDARLVPTNRIFALACVFFAACGSSAPKEIPSKAERLEGFDVDVDVRSATVQNGNIVLEALAKNGEPKSLIDLHV